MFGALSVIGLIVVLLAEPYNRKKSNKRTIEYEKKQCEELGIEPFEVRLKQIVEQAEWR